MVIDQDTSSSLYHHQQTHDRRSIRRRSAGGCAARRSRKEKKKKKKNIKMQIDEEEIDQDYTKTLHTRVERKTERAMMSYVCVERVSSSQCHLVFDIHQLGVE